MKARTYSSLKTLSFCLLSASLLLSSCKKSTSDNATPNPNPNPSGNNPNTGDPYKDGLPDVISGVNNGVEEVRYTITEYKNDLPTKVSVYGLTPSGRGNATAVYNSDYTLQSVSFQSEGGASSLTSYSYTNGLATQIISQGTNQNPDTLIATYDATGKLVSETSRTTYTSGGYFSRNTYTRTYHYDNAGRADSAKTKNLYYSRYSSSSNVYRDSSTSIRLFRYDANGRLTKMIRPSTYNSSYDEATNYYYIDDLVGSHIDLTLKNSLVQFALGAGNDLPPPAVSKTMGIGLLLQQTGRATDPYLNPYVATRVTVDSKPAYKITSNMQPGSTYLQIKMK